MALAGLGLAACAPAPAPEELAQAMPPDGRMIDVQGTRLHLVQQGRGPDVILLHGASGSLRDFTFDLVERLAPHFRVTAFDRPGLGLSDALVPDGAPPARQAALLDRAAGQLGLRRAVVVGHSFGAAVALAWALDHPARVGAVVTLAGVIEPWPGGLGPIYPLATTRLGGATLPPLMAGLARAGLAGAAARAIFAPQPLPEGYLEHMRLDLTLRPEVLRANMRQVAGLKEAVAAMSPRYERLAVPVEIVHGTRDRIVPVAVHASPFVARVRGARLVEIEGGGHMIHHAAPGATVAAIARAARRAGLGSVTL